MSGGIIPLSHRARLVLRKLAGAFSAARSAQPTDKAPYAGYLDLFTADFDKLSDQDDYDYLHHVAGGSAVAALRAPAQNADEAGRSAETLAPGKTKALAGSGSSNRNRLVLDQSSSTPRRALLMFRRDGLPHSEIARRLGIAEHTVGPSIAQALRNHRDQLWRDDPAHRLHALYVPRNLNLSNEAIDWVVRLGSGSATWTERAVFADWRSRSPAHVAATSEVMALLKSIGSGPA